MRTYRHTQFGVLILIITLVMMAVVVTISAWERTLYPAAVVLPVIALVPILFGWLTVVVDQEAVECRLGLGLIRRRLLLGEIEHAQVVSMSWFYGYGLRFTPRGWLYRVSGLSSVELLLANGKRVLIGSDEPRDLLRAIARRRPDVV